MRREPTEEQKAKAEQRRGIFRDLAKQLSGMDDAQRAEIAARLPAAVTVEGHALSPLNTVLCSFQRENVTLVGGFRQWRRAGRTVKKGERGLMIWIPKAPRNGNGAEPMPDAAPSQPRDPQPEEQGRHPNFIMGTVFDVSQTEGLA